MAGLQKKRVQNQSTALTLKLLRQTPNCTIHINDLEEDGV
jgi:hypothetical protein